MEGHCSTGQSPQWAVVPVEEEEDEGVLHSKLDNGHNPKKRKIMLASYIVSEPSAEPYRENVLF